MNNYIKLCLVVCLWLLSWIVEAHEKSTTIQTVNLIPSPTYCSVQQGTVDLPTGQWTYFIHSASDQQRLKDYLFQTSQLRFVEVSERKKAFLQLIINPQQQWKLGDAGYELIVQPQRVQLCATTDEGAFYGLQSLMQLVANAPSGKLSCLTLQDAPRFPYRGLLLDVSRHFRSVEFIKRQMDAMAAVKLNRLHLHLTDGAGWRLEIPKYPRLTSFAAWRPQSNWQDWSANGAKYVENKDVTTPQQGTYGGYYTASDIKELVQYAHLRHIEIIPEIEMPGHSEEVLAAYPELSCSHQPYVDSDFCAGNEQVFTFLRDVIDQVIQLFPSKEIHIGGDEASKRAWKTCPLCQAKMKEQGFSELSQLQNYLIQRMRRYIESKGRRIIGYDEIVEGSMLPSSTPLTKQAKTKNDSIRRSHAGVTVMAWRNTDKGKEALAAGYRVILSPAEYCYLDYTQDAPFKEPVSIGGYLPLASVYSFNPIGALSGMNKDSVNVLLRGVQGNLWTEYIPTDEKMEYMLYPRAFAIAEIGWSQTRDAGYDDFRKRALALLTTMQARGYHTFPLDNEYGERPECKKTVVTKALHALVKYNQPYSSYYPAAGDVTLTDGQRGGWTFRDQKWQGTMKDMDAVIDLGQVQTLHYVGATFMHLPSAWVHVPSEVMVSLSDDGVNFTPVGVVKNNLSNDIDQLVLKDYGVTFQGSARYVRFQAQRNARPGAWLFTDEIVVN